jgi:signal peptidase II
MSEGREQLSAKSGWARWAVTVVVAIVVVVLDQWSKNLIEQNIPLGGSLAPFPALEPWFTLVHWTNTGAAFGLLRGQAPLFVAIALVVIVVVLIYSRQLPANSWAVRICLGLMLGGATGNLIDRLHQGGQVTDFLLFSLPVGDRVYSWPAWNVADACIVVGTILLGILLLRSEHAKAPASEGLM